ncbi:hypothetical protein D8674_004015 [Pyrus ussuriensis x Pyrus communis]|uniref:Uncharacterized protein n=1 Tax=Pyrus ussuriensis x Pyrus communis TaxID=2448454 RepID=A0A5N5FNX0_9ROSA|nr:hypothetical protein D8674_004015 [Pyrus ussuriensis x Pyrus communis]
MPLDGSSEDIPKVYTEVLADEDAGCSSRSGEGITPSEVKMEKAVLEVFEEDGYLCYKDEELTTSATATLTVIKTIKSAGKQSSKASRVLTTKGISCEDSDFGRYKTFFPAIFASC